MPAEIHDDDLSGIFQEPPGYLPPEKPCTFQQVKLDSGQELSLRLVGSNPLWGHLLWNAARTLTSYLVTHAPTLVAGKAILELGAGAGLPSLVCVHLGARKVVVTDYPDQALIDNLNYNINNCDLLSPAQKSNAVCARGYIWGASVEPLVQPLQDPPASSGLFDTLLLADTLFNHPTHPSLVHTIKSTLARTSGSRALVFFTPHRPWLLEQDMAFFTLAREGGLAARRVREKWYEAAIFEGEGKWEGRKEPHGWEAQAEKDIRRVVWGFELAWADLIHDSSLWHLDEELPAAPSAQPAIS